MNSNPKVGGVVFGRPADNSETVLDFATLLGRRTGKTLTLT